MNRTLFTLASAIVLLTLLAISMQGLPLSAQSAQQEAPTDNKLTITYVEGTTLEQTVDLSQRFSLSQDHYPMRFVYYAPHGTPVGANMLSDNPAYAQKERNAIWASETAAQHGISTLELNNIDGCWKSNSCPAILIARAEFRPVMDQDALTAIQQDPIVASAQNEINYAFFVLERLAAWMSQQWYQQNIANQVR